MCPGSISHSLSMCGLFGSIPPTMRWGSAAGSRFSASRTVDHGVIQLQQGRLLGIAEALVGGDRIVDAEVAWLGLVRKPAHPPEQLIGSQAEPLGDSPKDDRRRTVQPSFDLTEVRVRDVAHSGQVAQRQLRHLPLPAEVTTKIRERLGVIRYFSASLVGNVLSISGRPLG